MTVFEGYKEIKVGGKATVEDENPKNVVVEIDLDNIEDDVQDIPNDKEEQAAAPVEPKKPEAPKKEHRSQKRIRELAKQRTELEERLMQVEREKEELRQKYETGNKSSKEALKTALEGTISSVSKQMAEAIRAGEADLVVSLQDDLVNAKMELAALNHDLKAMPTESPTPKEKMRQQPSLPAKALEWIEDHPEFKTDEVFYAATVAVNNQLLREGYNPEDSDLYEELNRRLHKRFPEVFGITEENDVELDKSSASPEEEVADVKSKTNSSAKARQSTQTVSGSSRPSSATPQHPAKKASVTLSPADIAQAERWGLSLEQMARRIAHADKNTRQDGYISIFMDKTK